MAGGGDATRVLCRYEVRPGGVFFLRLPPLRWPAVLQSTTPFRVDSASHAVQQFSTGVEVGVPTPLPSSYVSKSGAWLFMPHAEGGGGSRGTGAGGGDATRVLGRYEVRSESEVCERLPTFR